MGFKKSSTVHSLNPVPLGHGLFHPLDINAVIELNSSSGQANTTAEPKKQEIKNALVFVELLLISLLLCRKTTPGTSTYIGIP